MTTLTNTAIDAMPEGAQLRDDKVVGLSIRRHRGGRSWMLYYRTKAGVVRRPKLGAYPLVPLAAAREIARQMLIQVAAGKDPVAERELARAEPTVAELWTRAEREHYCRGKSWDTDAKRLYHAHIDPVLGKVKASAVDYAAAQRVHAGLRKHLTTANRVLAILSKLLNLAELWGHRPMGSNPCQHVKRFEERHRRRYATPVEIEALGRALDAHLASDPSGVAFLYLLLYSGARPSEIAKGTPAMIQAAGDAGVLRIEDGKTGARSVFLPPPAMAAIGKLPADRVTLTGLHKVPRKLWRTIREEIGAGDLWARDLRRTFATVALSGGMSSSIVGELLGHRSAATTKIYAKLMEDPAHAAAAAVAARMQGIMGGGK